MDVITVRVSTRAMVRASYSKARVQLLGNSTPPSLMLRECYSIPLHALNKSIEHTFPSSVVVTGNCVE